LYALCALYYPGFCFSTKNRSFCLKGQDNITMNLELLKIVVNTGLFVLIWTVQLVVYPGLCYYNDTDIKRWHQVYTNRITVIVLPLMFSQLALYATTSYLRPGYVSIGLLVLVLLNWGVTFLLAVPLHNVIGSAAPCHQERQQLVKVNWIRTALWTIIFIISITYYEK
jgi:hypothetical protein